MLSGRGAPITFDFDTRINRTGTASLKWDRYDGKDVIPFWVADMDFLSPPSVMAALHQRVDHGVFGYTLPSTGLVEAVIGHLFDRYGWRVDPAWLVWLPGLVCGLNVACRATGQEEDGVVTAVPVYPPFLSAPRLSGRTLTTTELVNDCGIWRFDRDSFRRAINARTRLFLLCNPHNPVGRAFTRQELEELAAICAERDLVICSDEIHAGLVLDAEREHLPLAALSPEIARRTITLMAPSKTYNLPGLGCAFAVIPDDALRRRFRAAMAGIVPHVNLLGFTAAEAAYRDGEIWRQELLAYLRYNRDLVTEAVRTMPGLATTHVEATYLAWIDARGMGGRDPARFFEAAGVGLSDGADFGAPGFVRLNFGCSRSLLHEGLDRMRRSLLSAENSFPITGLPPDRIPAMSKTD